MGFDLGAMPAADPAQYAVRSAEGGRRVRIAVGDWGCRAASEGRLRRRWIDGGACEPAASVCAGGDGRSSRRARPLRGANGLGVSDLSAFLFCGVDVAVMAVQTAGQDTRQRTTMASPPDYPPNEHRNICIAPCVASGAPLGAGVS